MNIFACSIYEATENVAYCCGSCRSIVTKKLGTAEAIPDFFGSGKRAWSRLPAGVLLPSGERPAPTEAGAETDAAERHRWPALLGTRFWSGCEEARRGAGEEQG